MAAVESLERKSDQSPDGATATPLFEVNLAAVKRRAPHLHARLHAIEAPNTELVFDDSGGVDIVLQGQAFYGRDAVEEARLQVEAWCARSQREHINEP
ncbi:MAG TPA: hypothetical protein VLL72_11975, partial [Kiloniellales bacterium]|nr:hypothetical protein [Kiloniellales bacterium]